MSRELPRGTVTFLFTDVEGSTRLASELGEGWPGVVEEHNRILREAIRASGGVEVRTEGDAFFAVFASAPAAVAACVEAQRALWEHPWPRPVRVRMGLHTGQGDVGGDDYVGVDVHRAARVAAAAHGGQVLLSASTRAVVGSSLPPGVTLRDLGRHRLKDLAGDEHLHQLAIDGLPGDFPPPHTVFGGFNVPPQRTAFVGRAQELGTVRRLVLERNLVTLTGPGGTGKTRLAIEAASGLVGSFPDGVWFVDLAPVRDPKLVPQAIAHACGLRGDAAGPVEEALLEHVRGRSLLLLLDNFESVLEGVPVVDRLLDMSPDVRVLATSRTPLKLSGEQEVPVPPLALPDPAGEPASVARSEAVQLFVSRASSVDPAFELTEDVVSDVAEITSRLDGLPLAIELAAARIRMLPPRSICERLELRLPLLSAGPRDLPERQRTLRATMEWSYELLDDASRALFRRLSPFAGGWTIDDADAVANAGGEIGGETFEAMERLVDHSLVRRVEEAARPPRFAMLGTIREYAVERLREDDDPATIQRRHAERFAELAEEAGPQVTGPRGAAWGRILEEEHDNLRAALAWAVSAGARDLGLEMCAAMWRFWQSRGHLTEGRRWVTVLRELQGHRETPTEVRGLYAAGSLAYWQADLEEAHRLYAEGLALAERLGEPRLVAEGHYNAGYALGAGGSYREARRQFEEAVRGFDGAGDRRMVAHVFTGLAMVANQAKDHQAAFRHLQDAERTFQQVGDRWGLVLTAGMAAQFFIEQERYPEARAVLVDSFRRAADLEEILGKAVALDALAAIESREGKHRTALVLTGAADRLRELGQGRPPGSLVLQEDVRAAAGPYLEAAEIDAALEEGRALDVAEVDRLVLGGQG